MNSVWQVALGLALIGAHATDVGARNVELDDAAAFFQLEPQKYPSAPALDDTALLKRAEDLIISHENELMMKDPALLKRVEKVTKMATKFSLLAKNRHPSKVEMEKRAAKKNKIKAKQAKHSKKESEVEEEEEEEKTEAELSHTEQLKILMNDFVHAPVRELVEQCDGLLDKEQMDDLSASVEKLQNNIANSEVQEMAGEFLSEVEGIFKDPEFVTLLSEMSEQGEIVNGKSNVLARSAAFKKMSEIMQDLSTKMMTKMEEMASKWAAMVDVMSKTKKSVNKDADSEMPAVSEDVDHGDANPATNEDAPPVSEDGDAE